MSPFVSFVIPVRNDAARLDRCLRTIRANDYPVERYLRNCKAAIIYEGTRDIHTLMQADWALGLKKEKPARRTLPSFKKSV